MWTPTYRKFKETLQSMCRMTTPYGSEPYVWAYLPSPPHGAAPGSMRAYGDASTTIDEDGNYIVRIPGQGSRIMWTSHCDTADNHPTHVNLKLRNDMLSSDGKSILGADDKVGVAIMAMMVRAGIPGTYCFFAGEEVGCVGSRQFSKDVVIGDYDACISLDRKGYGSTITHQCGSRCCSDAWASQLSEAIYNESAGLISLKNDPTGVFTDSREFVDIIPECTNISVGYFNQHTNSEKADIGFAYQLCCALIRVASKGLVPTPIRNPLIDDQDNDYRLSRWLNTRSYKKETSEFFKDPDFYTDEEWQEKFGGFDDYR